jgi:hypothetical protein
MKTNPPLGPSQRDLPAQTLVSEGGKRTPLIGILAVVEIQTVPVEESWRRWTEDFPLQRERILT